MKKLVVAVEVLEDGLRLPHLLCKGTASALYWTARFLEEVHASEARDETASLRDTVEHVAERIQWLSAGRSTPKEPGVEFEITGRGQCANCRKKLSMKYSQCASCADERGP